MKIRFATQENVKNQATQVFLTSVAHVKNIFSVMTQPEAMAGS